MRKPLRSVPGLMPFFALLICRTLGALKLPWPYCHIHVNTLKSMHSLDLLHKCHAYVPPLKIWALIATVPTTARLFLLHDLFTAPIPQSHKQQGGLHFQALMVQSLSVTDPFPPLTHSQHVSNTVNSIQTASGCPSPLSHPHFPQSCSSHLKHAFASLSCPSSSPTQQPEHFSKLSNLSPCI